MSVVGLLADPGATLGVVGGAIATAYPAYVVIGKLILSTWPAPKNPKSGWAIARVWLEYTMLAFGHMQTANTAKLKGDVVVAPGPPFYIPPGAPKA